MASKIDLTRELETGEGTFLFATGVLATDVYGLIKNKNGKFVTPVYKVDESGNVQSFVQKDGKPIPMYSFKFDGKQKTIKQKRLSGKTKQYCLLLKCEKGKDQKPVYYRIEAREDIAIEMNMYYSKGDKVSMLAKKYKSMGSETGRSDDVWVVQSIQKTKDSFVSRENLNYQEEYES